MIWFSSSGWSQTYGTWPYFPLFYLSSFFVISCHFVFCLPENVSCDKYYHRCKKLNCKACIHVKILKLHHLKGTISENIWLHQKFCVGGSFVPHCLSNICNALSECFYIQVLLLSTWTLFCHTVWSRYKLFVSPNNVPCDRSYLPRQVYM
jgi:hypothetical protein